MGIIYSIEKVMLSTIQGIGTAHKMLAIGCNTTVARAANGVASLWASILRDGPPIGSSAAKTVAGTTDYLVGTLGDRSWS